MLRILHPWGQSGKRRSIQGLSPHTWHKPTNRYRLGVQQAREMRSSVCQSEGHLTALAVSSGPPERLGSYHPQQQTACDLRTEANAKADPRSTRFPPNALLLPEFSIDSRFRKADQGNTSSIRCPLGRGCKNNRLPKRGQSHQSWNRRQSWSSHPESYRRTTPTRSTVRRSAKESSSLTLHKKRDGLKT